MAFERISKTVFSLPNGYLCLKVDVDGVSYATLISDKKPTCEADIKMFIAYVTGETVTLTKEDNEPFEPEASDE